MGLRQRELAERSGVSQAIVREIQHQTVERRRSRRTLEALSLALEWHPEHLWSILRGQKPLEPGQTGDETTDKVLARLDAIDDRLDGITERLDAVDAHIASVVDALGRRESP
nr:XRE family transcriptional regulator [Haloechinothrix aidingensis]